MNDELILEGKKYISASRVSKITGYNSDYLGQLCRGSKLICKMINRSWFVEEKSLQNHQLTNGRKKYKILGLESLGSAVFSDGSVKPTNRSPLLLPVSLDFLEHLKKELTLKNLRFLKSAKTLTFGFVFNLFLGLAVALSFTAIIFDFQTIFVDRHPTLLGRQFESVSAGLGRSFSTLPGASLISDFFRQPPEIYFRKFGSLFQKVEPSPEAETLTIQSDGTLVLPALPDPADRAAAGQYVQNIFSDEVVVEPDESGATGVIKPVFRGRSEDEYTYVLVPRR